MELFSPERPEITPGQKALLLDGSAVPAMLCHVLPDNQIRIMVMLRRYDAHGGYGWNEFTCDDIEFQFIVKSYRNDPEWTLRTYFNWTPQRVRVAAEPEVKAAPRRVVVASTYATDLL